MKILFTACLSLALLIQAVAQNTRAYHSDSLDVLHYDIHLTITDFTGKTIGGFTELQMKSRVADLTTVSLDLLALEIDSIRMDGVAIPAWFYNDTLIRIPAPFTYQPTDTFSVRIYYHGIPKEDPGIGHWGGFKWSGTTAFNLGVGFEADPHNFGRVWYPCIDDFVDRATYDCHITVDSTLGHLAICGGTLQSVTNNGNGTKTCHWNLHDEIPTYLASVAVGPYVLVADTFNGILGPVPSHLWVFPADTHNTRLSFVHLEEIFHAFESHFGPYRWERVGFVGVNFNSGAMEHATNVAYPRFCLNGYLDYEDLYAHELGHSWFGNLATCSTAEDMWINEGLTTFTEFVYLEQVYGRQAYLDSKRLAHNQVVRYNHIEEQGYLPLYGIPHTFTYGSTVYEKGSMVTQSLRGHLGDSVFFPAIKDYLNHFAFKDVSSEQMRDYLTMRTGLDMTGFFDSWVFTPGFPHFSVDSFIVNGTAPNCEVVVWTKEKLRGRTTYSYGNRIPVTFIDTMWFMHTDTVFLDGGFGCDTIQVPFVPSSILMDMDEQISDATSDLYKTIKTAGTYDFLTTYFAGIVSQVNDSALVRVEHNWVAPDSVIDGYPGLYISRERYWKIDGIFPYDFIMQGKFFYSKTNSSSNGHLDQGLMTNTIDSMVLLYRPGAGYNWEIVPFTRTGNSFYGYVYYDTLVPGEYALAMWDWEQYLKIPIIERENSGISVWPNPGDGLFTLQMNTEGSDDSNIKVYDLHGNVVYQGQAKNSISQINLSFLPKGLYLLKVEGPRKSACKRIVIQ